MRAIFHLKIELSQQDHFPITIDELDMQAVIGTKKTFVEIYKNGCKCVSTF